MGLCLFLRIVYLTEFLHHFFEVGSTSILYMMMLRMTWLWTQDKMVELHIKFAVVLLQACGFPSPPSQETSVDTFMTMPRVSYLSYQWPFEENFQLGNFSTREQLKSKVE